MDTITLLDLPLDIQKEVSKYILYFKQINHILHILGLYHWKGWYRSRDLAEILLENGLTSREKILQNQDILEEVFNNFGIGTHIISFIQSIVWIPAIVTKDYNCLTEYESFFNIFKEPDFLDMHPTISIKKNDIVFIKNDYRPSNSSRLREIYSNMEDNNPWKKGYVFGYRDETPEEYGLIPLSYLDFETTLLPVTEELERYRPSESCRFRHLITMKNKKKPWFWQKQFYCFKKYLDLPIPVKMIFNIGNLFLNIPIPLETERYFWK